MMDCLICPSPRATGPRAWAYIRQIPSDIGINNIKTIKNLSNKE